MGTGDGDVARWKDTLVPGSVMRRLEKIAHGRRERAHRAAAAATVNIHVRDLAQLFNSFDPSPFWDRDLDGRAAQFIEDEFRDKQSAAVWHLHVHVQEGLAAAEDLQT